MKHFNIASILVLLLVFCSTLSYAEDLRYCIDGHKEYENKNYNKAIELTNLCIDSGSLNNSNLSVAYKTIGNSYLMMDNFNEGAKFYSKAINANPKDPVNYYNRCGAYGHLKKYELDLADCNTALKIKPGYTEVYYFRGQAMVGLERYQDAVNDYDLYINNFRQDNKWAFEKRGFAHQKLGNNEKALKDYSSAIDIEPSEWLYANRAFVLEYLGKYMDAISDFSNAIRFGPDHASYYYERGLCHHLLQEYAEAIRDYEKSISVDDTFLDAYNNLSWLLSTSRDESLRDGIKSLEYATKYIELKKTHPGLDTLAAAHARIGNFKEAVNIQEEAIAMARQEGKDIHEYEKHLQLYRHGKPYTEE